MKNVAARSLVKSLRLAAIVLLGLIIYAYGFQVTKVSFQEIRSETRQERLTRVLRALAQPDIIRFEQEESVVETSVRVPCPAEGFTPPAPDTSGPYLVLTPGCAGPRQEIRIEGFNFAPKIFGPINFIPPSEVSLRIGDMQTDENGHFEATVRLPARDSDQVQRIRTVTRRNVGLPSISQNAIDTWNLIIQTIFLALLATTFGVIFSVPISFFAARNLMKDVTSPLSSLTLSIIGWPLGIFLGGKIAAWLGNFSQSLADSPLIVAAALLVSAALAVLVTRWALPQEEESRPSAGLRLARSLALLGSSGSAVLALFLFSHLAISSGSSLAPRLGWAGFLAMFVANLGEITDLLITGVAALAGGAVVSGLLGKFGKGTIDRLTPAVKLGINLVLGPVAGAILFALVGAGLDWLYQIDNPALVLWWPAAVGAGLGLLTAILTRSRDVLPIGLVIYYITRTILNGLRAIEALVMVIVFVIWVGIGPFAGVLALSLHTVAALAKLYSEQVESISSGPLEAIKATGATRLQMIVYAVIPQIVPPYISFTMYRWDINVRMSTIIGFAGGGGIGFLLQQNINLLNYRAASAQMLAIAVVVALMDFLSSYMRERVV